jgi:hypothetical protein
MWSRHTFSLARLEPTRTGVGSTGAKMESVVGVRRQEVEAWRRGEMARREWDRAESGADQKGTGKVTAGLSGEDGFIGKGEGQGLQCGGAHEVGKG